MGDCRIKKPRLATPLPTVAASAGVSRIISPATLVAVAPILPAVAAVPVGIAVAVAPVVTVGVAAVVTPVVTVAVVAVVAVAVRMVAAPVVSVVVPEMPFHKPKWAPVATVRAVPVAAVARVLQRNPVALIDGFVREHRRAMLAIAGHRRRSEQKCDASREYRRRRYQAQCVSCGRLIFLVSKSLSHRRPPLLLSSFGPRRIPKIHVPGVAGPEGAAPCAGDRQRGLA
jgi:hypothetical protein